MFMQVWLHLGVQMWHDAIRHLGSILDIIGRGRVVHLGVWIHQNVQL